MRAREGPLRDQEPHLARWRLQSGSLGPSCGCRCVGHFCGGTAMTLVVPFAMGLVASTPLLPMWPTAYFLEFAGPTFSGPMGDAPASICGWTPMGTRKARLVRADKGIFCLCPIGPVGYRGIRVCRRGFKGPMGRGSGGSMGGENLGMGGVQAYGRPVFF